MLISEHEIRNHIGNLQLTGALHIGAHECEELVFYDHMGVAPTDIYWFDAYQEKVDQANQRGIPNVYQAVVSNEDNKAVTFHITNNIQSSSILEFGTHEINHSHVKVVQTRKLATTTIDTLVAMHDIPIQKLNFWNFDIQGAELLALKGAVKSLKYAGAIYLEVNTEEVYKKCALVSEIDAFLEPHGFKRVLTQMTHAGWGDALYVRTSS
jgi:FkbM family methyltransferase